MPVQLVTGAPSSKSQQLPGGVGQKGGDASPASLASLTSLAVASFAGAGVSLVASGAASFVGSFANDEQHRIVAMPSARAITPIERVISRCTSGLRTGTGLLLEAVDAVHFGARFVDERGPAAV